VGLPAGAAGSRLAKVAPTPGPRGPGGAPHEFGVRRLDRRIAIGSESGKFRLGPGRSPRSSIRPSADRPTESGTSPAPGSHPAPHEPRTIMSLEIALADFPKELELRNGLKCELRPLEAADEAAFHEFFLEVPTHERMFIKHRVTDPEVIRSWCREIDLGRNLPLLALADGKIIATATLHQQLGGWKRHIGRVSVLVVPRLRGLGLARSLIGEIIEIARQLGLEKAEAEFIGEQEAAVKVFNLLGFQQLCRLPDYVKDMEAGTHDYILTGLDLQTDEEYAGMG
jgi:GNAT superfamily N-acetyltransferase